VFECKCNDYFTGDYCEISTDDCAQSPCSDYGTSICVDGVDMFECTCLEGYVGTRCDVLAVAAEAPPIYIEFTLGNETTREEFVVNLQLDILENYPDQAVNIVVNEELDSSGDVVLTVEFYFVDGIEETDISYLNQLVISGYNGSIVSGLDQEVQADGFVILVEPVTMTLLFMSHMINQWV
jgi:hypothetical protein